MLYDESTKRYRLHDLARLFADSKLSADERAVSQKRFATHYKDVLAAAEVLCQQGGAVLVPGLALFDLEWSNIQAGHAWVAAQHVDGDEDVARLGMAYPDAGFYILDLRHHPRERIRWLEIALAAAGRLKNRAFEGITLNSLGMAYADLGENQRAIQLHKQSLSIALELGDRAGEGNALGNLGVAYHNLGENERAVQVHERYLTIARELGNRAGEGNALGNLGAAYMNLGENERSIQSHEEALLIRRDLGDRRGEGIALGNLGNVYAKLGETQRAIQFYEQRFVIAREIGDRRGEGNALWSMSRALDRLGQRAQSIQHAEQALTIYEQIEDPNAAQVRAALAAWREQTNT